MENKFMVAAAACCVLVTGAVESSSKRDLLERDPLWKKQWDIQDKLDRVRDEFHLKNKEMVEKVHQKSMRCKELEAANRALKAETLQDHKGGEGSDWADSVMSAVELSLELEMAYKDYIDSIDKYRASRVEFYARLYELEEKLRSVREEIIGKYKLKIKIMSYSYLPY